MIRIFRSVTAKVWALTLLMVMVAGLLMGALRLLLPLAADYRAQVQAGIAGVIGLPVHVGSFHMRLRGFTPQLVVANVAILSPDSGRPLLQFREARLDLDPGALIGAWERRVTGVVLVGGRLLLKRRSDGALVLDGMGSARAFGEDAGGGELFLTEGRLRLQDSEVFWENQRIGSAPMRFTQVNMDFVNEGDRHQLTLSARLPDVVDGEFWLAADLVGNPREPRAWGGDIYLRGDRLMLAPLFRDRLPTGYRLDDGQLHLEVWSRWERGEPVSVQGRGDLSDLLLRAPGDADAAARRSFSVQHLAGRWAWYRTDSGWRLDVADFRMSRAGADWPSSRFSLATRLTPDGGWDLQLDAEYLRLEDVLAVALLFPIEGHAQLTEQLRAVRPVAGVRDLRLSFRQPGTGPAGWRAEGHVDGMQFEPWRQMPGVRGLDATFVAQPQGGWMELSSSDLQVTFATLFRHPLQADRFSGRLDWRFDPGDGLLLEAKELVLENSDIRTASRLRLQLPHDGGSPLLDMQTDFHDGDAATTHRYLPTGIMPEKLVAWLDRAIVSGRVPAGSFLFRGRLGDFPFRHDEGRFEVLFGAEQLVLDYQEGWPRLEEVGAEVRFLNDSLSIHATDAKVLDTDVTQVDVRLAPLRGAPAVEIRGRTRGPFEDALRILRETPLAARHGHYVAGMEAAGESLVNLRLAVPLRPQVDWRLAGDIGWTDARLRIPERDLELQRIRGRLDFDLDGVRGSDIRARALGSEVRIDVSTDPGDGRQPGHTWLDAGFSLSAGALAQRYPGIGLEMLDGAAHWRLRLDIPHQDPESAARPVSLDLVSNLDGMRISLPDPLGKPPAATARFSITGRMGGHGRDRLDIAYAGKLRAAIELDSSGRVRRGEIRLGGGSAEIPSDEGLRLKGALERLDLEPWIDWLTHRPSGGSAFGVLESIDLQVAQLRVHDHLLRGARLLARPQPRGWHAQLDSDRAEGEFLIPIDWRREPLQADFLRLSLDTRREEAVPASPDSPTEASDPRRLPALDLRVRNLEINGQAMGGLRLRGRAVPRGLEFPLLQIEGELLSLRGQGSWLVEGQAPHSDLQLEGESSDLGALLGVFGYATVLDDAPSQLQLSLGWPAAPWRPSLSGLQGQLRFEIGKGRVLDVEPGVGRVLGLFSLGALKRRLSLDFSDMFKKGYSFDRIQGSFELKDGNAYTHDLVIEGPSSEVSISGRTGLLSRDYDQLVSVVPRVSGGLPVAGAIAGGPVVGAALLVVQQMLGSKMDKMSRFEYQVTGSWEDPRFTRIKDGPQDLLKSLFRRRDGASDGEAPAAFLNH